MGDPRVQVLPSVLLIDDEDVFRERLARALHERGYEVRTAADGARGLALAREDSPEYALVDLRMPGLSGLEVVSGLKAIDATTRVVVLTGYGSIATAVDAMGLGATHYLSKPADADEILAAFTRGDAPIDPTATRALMAPTLARAEWEHINRVLSDCRGNISEASRRLGVHRRSLQRKLQKHPPSE